MSCYLLLLKTVEKSKKKSIFFLYRSKSFMILEETVLRNLEKLFLRSFTKFEQVCHKNHCQYHEQFIFTLTDITHLIIFSFFNTFHVFLEK